MNVANESLSETITSLTESVGVGSSSRIVPMPRLSANDTARDVRQIHEDVSLASSSASLRISTEIVFDVSPGAKFSEPEIAVKSLPEVAVAVGRGVVDDHGSTADGGELDRERRGCCAGVPSTIVTSLIVTLGVGSLSAIVPRPWLSAIVALLALDRFTKNVSFSSSSRSPRTWMLMDFVVSPGTNVSVPEFARYSSGAVAVLSAVAKSTETLLMLIADNDTVNVSSFARHLLQ